MSGQNIMIPIRTSDSGGRIRISKSLGSQKIHLDLPLSGQNVMISPEENIILAEESELVNIWIRRKCI